MGCQQVPSSGSLNLVTGGTATDFNHWCFGHIPVDGPTDENICVITIQQGKIYSRPAETTTDVTYGDCTKYNLSAGTCESADFCRASSLFDKNLKICSSNLRTCLDGCYEADGGASCAVCLPGYDLGADGRCTMSPNPAGCQTVGTDGKCTQCRNNEKYIDTTPNPDVYATRFWVLKNGVCENWTSKSHLINCAQITAEGLCKTCLKNYDLVDAVCKQNIPTTIPIGIYGCKTFDGTKCTAALDGFVCNTAGTMC